MCSIREQITDIVKVSKRDFNKVTYDLENGKALSFHISCTWCDIILIFKLHRRTQLTPYFSIHSLKFEAHHTRLINMDIY